jgi:hypothetical protein
MGIWLIALLAFGALPAHTMSCDNDEIRAVVEKLGYETDDDDYKKNFELLATRPLQATCHLIKELHVVPETKITQVDAVKHASSMHVIWCIRALRYLTGGLDFTARTHYQFKKFEHERKHFLTIKSKEELPFFGVWMSRDIVYIAPQDVQSEIIVKWRNWYLQNGISFHYHPSENIDEWYF